MATPLKICIATTSFPRWRDDGRGTFVWEAARAIHGQGNEVRVIAMHNPGSKTHEYWDGIEIFRPRYLWPERLEILQKEGGGLPVMWRKSQWTKLVIWPFLLVHTIAIADHARGCDIIHANWTLSAAAALAGHPVHRRPILLTTQGSDLVRAARMPMMGWITRQVLQGCKQVIALSHALAQTASAIGFAQDRVMVIPNGVDIRFFSPSPLEERGHLILFVGALSEIKGVTYLIASLPKVVARLPQYRLVIIGEGPLRDELLTLAHRLGVEGHVEFLGSQPPAQVRQWMRRARLFVLPSREEGLGVVLLEALASGTPCVASDVGGIPEVIVPEVGQLVPPADADAIADAISTMLTLPEARWREFSRNARQRAEERFDWAIIARQLVSAYRLALAEEEG